LLVVDDYHLAMGTALCEQFMDLITRQPQLGILMSTRHRPAWATSRRILYGEIKELGERPLAMTQEEARETLRHRDASTVPGVVDVAEGWPAVLGLAAQATDAAFPEGEIPQELHDFFAEELYGAVSTRTQVGLARLALVDTLSPIVAEALLGDDRTHVLAEATAVGFLSCHANRYLYLHPLLRSFLLRHRTGTSSRARDATVDAGVRALTSTANWDEAFSVIDQHDRPDLLVHLLEVSARDLLEGGRTASLSRWLNWADTRNVVAPICDLAEAELSFRRGEYEKSEVLAARAATSFQEIHPDRSRALTLAGWSAHLGEQVDMALRYFTDAKAAATTTEDKRAAAWGEGACTSYADPARGAQALAEFEALCDDSADCQVRLASGRLAHGLNMDGINEPLAEAKRLSHLLSRVRDPMIRSSFLYSYAISLAASADYASAAKVAEAAAKEAETNRLLFALPYILVITAHADAGLRNFPRALSLLRGARAKAIEDGDWYTAARGLSIEIRALVGRGRSDDAVDVDLSALSHAAAPVAGSALATRALALACASETEAALRLAAEARELTDSLEAHIFADAVQATADAKTNSSHTSASVASFLRNARTTGYHDAVVFTYRGCPDLLDSVEAPDDIAMITSLVVRSRDEALARAHGIPVTTRHAQGPLSPRESEVLDLLGEGLTNREIATRLFISEVTVKVHVRHIFDKLNVRSRTEAALHARAQRELGSPE
jgi:ATP/maltotriose-dependent transcriptional regulator MalT